MGHVFGHSLSMPLYCVTSPGKSITSFFTALILLSGIAVLSGQTAPLTPLEAEPLEKFQDAPMYIFENGVSAAMVSQQGPFTSYQVNVNSSGQNITGDAANEPSIVV